MLFFIAILLFIVGYLLNEEVSLARISKNLSYPHEGWLLIKYEKGLWFFIMALGLALGKALGLGLLLQAFYPQTWYFASVAYLAGNFWAVRKIGGLFFSIWAVLLAFLLLEAAIIIQLPLAVSLASYVLLRNYWLSFRLGQATLVMTLLYYFLPRVSLGIILGILACIISLKGAPFRIKLIK